MGTRMSRYILALDQGTTSSRAIVFGRDGRPLAIAQREFEQILPAPGHVEHDPEAIWDSQVAVARQVLEKAGISAAEIAAVGVANQRETTVLWERDTGRPIANAIVWQSRVTAAACERLKADGCNNMIRGKTGLEIDAYFSATKIRHLLDTVPGARAAAEAGKLAFGTVDSFLIWRLTGGTVHVTDMSNASRTMLFNIHTREWDDELLRLFDVPRAILPEVRASSELYGQCTADFLGSPLPISGAAGDQQAATFGQACFAVGSAKNTYGTGCFLLLNTGNKPVESKNRLLTTIGWAIGNEVTYCLEGAVFIAGAAIQWLRDGLGLIKASHDVERLAASVSDNDGVYFVPAFVGLGAPHWDPFARGAIVGLTRGTKAGHIARAAVESMAYQSRDLLDAMRQDAGVSLSELKVDGGASLNNALMQFQADLLGLRVRRPFTAETTALGAAYLAGLAVGYWKDRSDVEQNWAEEREFAPSMSAEDRDRHFAGWQRAVGRAKHWVEPE
ncbi:MAG: glycerol kinase GlpK [Pirellulales bacterium]